jgi:COP9 signalosome complex subunit 5
MAAGKVEIGVFRTYRDDYAEKKQREKGDSSGGASIPADKIGDFGLHAHKYYQIEHSFFKNEFDRSIIDSLWNEYWMLTLASSPLVSNSEFNNTQIANLVYKMNEFAAASMQGGAGGQGKKGRGGARFGGGNYGGSGSNKLDLEKFDPLVQQSSKVTVELSVGLIREFFKKFMFA